MLHNLLIEAYYALLRNDAARNQQAIHKIHRAQLEKGIAEVGLTGKDAELAKQGLTPAYVSLRNANPISARGTP